MIATTLRATAVAAFLAAAATTAAIAQQPAPPAAPAISATHLAAAKELALQLKVNDPIGVILDEMQSQIVNSLTTTRPELRKDLAEVLVAMNPDIAVKREEMVDRAASAFAKRFSEAEIAELQKFLKSPLGEKYIKAQPDAMNEYLQGLRQWVGELNDFVIGKIRVEMKKRGHDI